MHFYNHQPIPFTKNSSPLCLNFTSDYTVYFGRRYRGVPILGPTLGVRLDSEGELAAFMRGWRDISGETAPVTVLSSDAVTADAAATVESANDALSLKNAACGFIEGTSSAQTAAGIGCSLVYENAEAIGTLAEAKMEWVSLAEDSSIDLGVEAADADAVEYESAE